MNNLTFWAMHGLGVVILLSQYYQHPGNPPSLEVILDLTVLREENEALRLSAGDCWTARGDRLEAKYTLLKHASYSVARDAREGQMSGEERLALRNFQIELTRLVGVHARRKDGPEALKQRLIISLREFPSNLVTPSMCHLRRLINMSLEDHGIKNITDNEFQELWSAVSSRKT